MRKQVIEKKFYNKINKGKTNEKNYTFRFINAFKR